MSRPDPRAIVRMDTGCDRLVGDGLALLETVEPADALMDDERVGGEIPLVGERAAEVLGAAQASLARLQSSLGLPQAAVVVLPEGGPWELSRCHSDPDGNRSPSPERLGASSGSRDPAPPPEGSIRCRRRRKRHPERRCLPSTRFGAAASPARRPVITPTGSPSLLRSDRRGPGRRRTQMRSRPAASRTGRPLPALRSARAAAAQRRPAVRAPFSAGSPAGRSAPTARVPGSCHGGDADPARPGSCRAGDPGPRVPRGSVASVGGMRSSPRAATAPGRTTDSPGGARRSSRLGGGSAGWPRPPRRGRSGRHPPGPAERARAPGRHEAAPALAAGGSATFARSRPLTRNFPSTGTRSLKISRRRAPARAGESMMNER